MALCIMSRVYVFVENRIMDPPIPQIDPRVVYVLKAVPDCAVH
jgi:hypothetical protein